MTKRTPDLRPAGLRQRALALATMATLVGGSGILAAPTADAAEAAHRLATRAAPNNTQALPSPRKQQGILIDDELQLALASDKPVRFVIEFKEQADLSAAHRMNGADQWKARGRLVQQRLMDAAERSQPAVRKLLADAGHTFQSFWIKNVIVVENGSRNTVQNLLAFDEIAALRVYKPYKLYEPETTAPAPKAVGSNIGWIEANAVWANGYTGSGIVVANIDTGVRYTHEALRGSYRGNQGGGSYSHDYNWFDPYAGTSAPVDVHGHGSHTIGTMTGDDATSTNQIGVAPGAQWIACQGFNPSATDAGLLACGQFMVAPTTTGGAAPDPDKRPHVVNNSWGDCGQSYDNWYEGVIDAWIAAGIVPVFANGNSSNCGYSSPPGLNTVGNPARSKKVLGVGSTSNSSGTLASHSNWGPTDDTTALNPSIHPDLMGFDQLKPNVAAPGVSIRSALNSGDTAYGTMSGTSMSAPHVAGLVALMWEAAPCLVGDYATTGTLLMSTARPIDYNSGGTPAPGPGNIPNYATGWGEIDAADAVDAAILSCGPQGTVSGTVTDASSSLPLADADVSLHDPDEGRTYTARTDALGQYTKRVGANIASGYDIAVTRYAYLPDSASGVLVAEDATVVQDFALTAAPSYTVSGTVTDAQTGWPLAARIDISGYPLGPVWSDPLTGAYSVQLPAGSDYSLVATSSIQGYNTDTATIVALAGDTVEDLQVSADATCAAPGYAVAPVYAQDFEAGNGGFTSSGTNDAWAWGTPTAWPSACASGTRCWGTNLGGNYPTSAAMTLASPSIDLSSVAPGTNLVVRWQQANHIENATYDKGFAEVSINGGAWQTMWTHSGATAAVGWTERSFNISAAAGGTVAFRWRLTSDSSVTYPGLYVDKIEVLEAGGCGVPNGDLVIGTARDANTAAALNNVAVSVNGNPAAATATSAHPALGAGSFAVHVPAGAGSVAGDGAPIHPGYGVDTAAVSASGGATQRVDLDIPAGRLAFHPASGPTATLPLGSSSTQPFVAENQGTAPVNLSFEAMSLSAQFEDGIPPQGWTVTNNGGTSGCVWASNTSTGLPNYAGGQGIAATADSDACGSGTTMNTALVSPSMDLSTASSATLAFVLSYRHLGSSRFDVDVSVNGGAWATVYTRNTDASPTGPGTPVSISLTPYAGSADVRVRFVYVSPGWNWYAQVDQIQIYGGFDLIPWLSFAPPGAAGVVAPGAMLGFTGTYDASVVSQPGTYTAPLRVVHDTPYAVAPIAATMNVTLPADFAYVTGVLTGMGRCDANPAPLAGQTLSIQGQTQTYTVTTDGNGAYILALPSSESPLSISTAPAGHIAGGASGVVLTAGSTTTADIDLRADLPCLAVSPTSVAATLEQDGTGSRVVTLTNTGAGSLASWTATIGGAPGAPIDELYTQSASQAITAENSVTCNASGVHAENYFMRVYDHAEFGRPGAVQITHVEAGIEQATAASGGTQPAEVRLYRLNGTLSFANMTLLASKTVSVADGSAFVVSGQFDAPVTVQPGEKVVATLYLPDADATGHSLFPGSNAAGQTAPSYIAASDCSITQPTDTAAIGFPEMQLVLNLRQQAAGGSCDNPTAVDWMAMDPASGSVAADSSGTSDLLLDAAGLAVGSYAASVCLASSDAGAATLEMPVDLEVVAAGPRADLALDVVESADPVETGAAMGYTVSVTNDGPESAEGIEVVIQLPSSGSYDGASGAGWTCTDLGASLECALAGTLANGATSSFAVDYIAGDVGTQTLSATVSSSVSVDENPANDTVTVETTVVPVPTADLAITAAGPATAVDAGSVAAYTVNVSSLAGSDTATGVTVVATLPAGFSLAAGSGSGWSCAGAVCTLSGSLAAGASAATLTLQVQIDQTTATGTYGVLFTVASDLADGNAANNAATIDTDVNAIPLGDEIFSDGFED